MYIGPDSSSGKAFPLGVVGRGFESRPGRTKGVENGTSSSLADARIKRVVLGKYLNGNLLCRKIAHELMLSMSYKIISDVK